LSASVWARLQWRNNCLLAAADGRVFLDCVFNHSTGFAGELLNPTDQFFLLAFSVAEIIVRELRPFLFQLALRDIPVAFDFKCGHLIKFLFFVIRQYDGKVFLFASQAHPQGMTQHQGERDDCHRHQASPHFHFDEPYFIFHAGIILPGHLAGAMG
jgi:hypothetical protein